LTPEQRHELAQADQAMLQAPHDERRVREDRGPRRAG
jgi:hypothetical protein